MLNLKVTLEEHYSCQCRGTANVDNMSPFDNDYHVTHNTIPHDNESLSHDDDDDVMMVVFNNYLLVGTEPGNSQYIFVLLLLKYWTAPTHACC